MPGLILTAAGYAANAVSGWAYTAATTLGFSAGTASTISIYAAQAAAIGTVAGVTIGLGAASRPNLPDPEAGKLARRQSRPIRTIVMGEGARFSGAYMFREASGSTLGVVLALNDGRLASIDKIWLNDDVVTLDVDGFVQQGDDGRYGDSDLVQIKTRMGEPTETWFSEMGDKFAALWTDAHRGDGIASLMMLARHAKKENFNSDFPNGEPLPSVLGVPVCYDWRDESQDRDDESTWLPCSNPVVWLIFYEWYRVGRSWTRSIAPVLDALTEEADYCDVLVAKADASTEKRYRFGGWYPTDSEPQTVRDNVLASFDGWMTIDGKGCLVIKAGRYVAPTFTLTGEHIVGYNWRAFQQAEEVINKLIVSYVDPAHDYTEVECDPWVDEDSVAAIGIERSENLALQWVQSLSQARRLAKRKMSRLGTQRRGQIITDMHGMNALGERYIRVQNPELQSMADVVVEVMQIEIDPMTAQVVLDVILADPNIDAWNPATEEGAAVADVERPPLEPLTAPTISDVTPYFEETGAGSGVRLTIEGDGPDREDLTWFARWRVDGATSWSESQYTDAAPGSPVLLDTTFVTADADLEVQIAYQTGGGTLSPWSSTFDVTTTTPPPDIIDLDFLASRYIVGVASANQPSGLTDWTFTGPAGFASQTSGALTAFTANHERITNRGLLVEAATTNVLINSDSLSSLVGGLNVTNATDGTVAPTGVLARKISATTSASTTAVQLLNGTGSAAGNTLSTYAKKGTGATTGHRFILYNATTGLNVLSIIVDYDTGAITYLTGSTGAAMVALPSGWWRITLSATTGISAGNDLYAYLGFVGQSATAGQFVYLSGAQLEAGLVATSYIVAGGSSATRAADLAQVSLPSGDAADSITVTWDTGAQTFARSALANPLVLNLATDGAHGWIGHFLESVVMTPA